MDPAGVFRNHLPQRDRALGPHAGRRRSAWRCSSLLFALPFLADIRAVAVMTSMLITGIVVIGLPDQHTGIAGKSISAGPRSWAWAPTHHGAAGEQAVAAVLVGAAAGRRGGGAVRPDLRPTAVRASGLLSGTDDDRRDPVPFPGAEPAEQLAGRRQASPSSRRRCSG